MSLHLAHSVSHTHRFEVERLTLAEKITAPREPLGDITALNTNMYTANQVDWCSSVMPELPGDERV